MHRDSHRAQRVEAVLLCMAYQAWSAVMRYLCHLAPTILLNVEFQRTTLRQGRSTRRVTVLSFRATQLSIASLNPPIVTEVSPLDFGDREPLLGGQRHRSRTARRMRIASATFVRTSAWEKRSRRCRKTVRRYATGVAATPRLEWDRRVRRYERRQLRPCPSAVLFRTRRICARGVHARTVRSRPIACGTHNVSHQAEPNRPTLRRTPASPEILPPRST